MPRPRCTNCRSYFEPHPGPPAAGRKTWCPDCNALAGHIAAVHRCAGGRRPDPAGQAERVELYRRVVAAGGRLEDLWAGRPVAVPEAA